MHILKIVDGVKYLKIGEVAKKIGKSPQTIKHWYEWMSSGPETDKVLPKFYILDKRLTRFFKEEDLPAIIAFSESVKYGEMSDFNVGLWGERGQLISERGNQRTIKN